MLQRLAVLLFVAGTYLQASITYKVPTEDGTAEEALGLYHPTATIGGYVLWMNHFVIQPGGESIRQLQIAYGCPTCTFPAPSTLPFATGTPMYLWQGSSGNPTGATLVGQTNPVVIQPGQVNNNTFITMDLIGECCFQPGTHIFVGTLLSIGPGITNDFRPAAADHTFPVTPGGSWIQISTSSVLPDVTTLSGSYFSTIEQNFLIRAVAEECPEPAAYLLTAAGLCLAAVLRRRF